MSDVAAASEDAKVGLKRDLSSRELFTLAFGATVGVSWIILVGPWIGGAGSVGSMLAFTIGGVLIIPIGLCYAYLGQRFPATGGEYVYAYRFFGGQVAFATAWVLALLYLSICAFEAISVPWLAFSIWPGLKGPLLYTFNAKPFYMGDALVAGGASLMLCGLQLRGAQVAARIQDIMAFALIGMALAFSAAGVWTGRVENLTPLFGQGLKPFVALLLTTPLFYAGFGSVPQALGESAPNALRRIPAVILAVIIGAILFHIVVILATALVLTPTEAAGSNLTAALAFQHAFQSPRMAAAALVAGLLGLLLTWNAILYSGSRVLYALGHGRLGPGWLGRTEPRRGVPRVAILLVTGVTLIGIPFGKDLMTPVISLGGLCVTLVFLLIAACVLRSELTALRAGEFVGSYRRFMILPLLSLCIAAGLLWLNGLEIVHSLAQGQWLEVAAMGGWAVFGLAVWIGSSGGRRSLSNAQRDALIMGVRVQEAAA